MPGREGNECRKGCSGATEGPRRTTAETWPRDGTRLPSWDTKIGRQKEKEQSFWLRLSKKVSWDERGGESSKGAKASHPTDSWVVDPVAGATNDCDICFPSTRKREYTCNVDIQIHRGVRRLIIKIGRSPRTAAHPTRVPSSSVPLGPDTIAWSYEHIKLATKNTCLLKIIIESANTLLEPQQGRFYKHRRES